jgi:hypothetical protein
LRARHQQQRRAVLLRAVPAVEQYGFIERIRIVDRFALAAPGEPAREQRLARSRRAGEHGGAERPRLGRGQRLGHLAVGLAEHDPRRAARDGPAKVERQGNL